MTVCQVESNGAGWGGFPRTSAFPAKIWDIAPIGTNMKIAFLADPLSGFKIYKDSTFAMMREAARRGHRIYAFEQRHLVLDQGVVTAEEVKIQLTGDPVDWYHAGEAGTVRLSEFDAVIQRQDPPF